MSAAGQQQKPKAVGLRVALTTYLVIVIAGLAGTGAHAMWNQSGTVTAGVTAGTWAPKPVDGNTVSCTREHASGGKVDVTFSWTATDATSYIVAATGASTPAPVTTSAASATLRVDRPDLFGTDTYQITITPEAAGMKATPTRIHTELIRAVLRPEVECAPLN